MLNKLKEVLAELEAKLKENKEKSLVLLEEFKTVTVPNVDNIQKELNSNVKDNYKLIKAIKAVKKSIKHLEKMENL